MIQVIYMSQATHPFTPVDLRRLLTASRLRNQAAGLTGVLLYREGTFVQLLEGERSDLEATLDRIRRDPRHGDIRILSETLQRQRLFPEWRMRFEDWSSESLVRRGFDQLASGGHLASMTDEALIDLVHGVSPRARAA